MTNLPAKAARGTEEIKTAILEIQDKIAESLDEMADGIQEFQDDRLGRELERLRNLITNLWLSNTALVMLLERAQESG